MTNWQSSAMIAAALISITGCYAISVKAASERAAIVAARVAIVRDMSDMRLLRAELRTRSRLPELQRWNEQVLALAPPRAEQLIVDPVQLASYAVPGAAPAPAASAPPAATVAVVRDAPVPVPALRQASFGARVARDLGTDAALAGGVAAMQAGPAAALQVGYQKIALR